MMFDAYILGTLRMRFLGGRDDFMSHNSERSSKYPRFEMPRAASSDTPGAAEKNMLEWLIFRAA